MVLAVASVAAMGCGDAVKSAPAAARVEDTVISPALVRRWMAVLAPNHAVPDAPRYVRCIVREREVNTTSEVQAKGECRQQYESLKARALGLLITSTWLEREAEKDGVAASSAAVRRELRKGTRTLPAAAAPDSADRAYVFRAEAARLRILKLLRKLEPPIAPSAIAKFYTQNRRQFEARERREFTIIERLSRRQGRRLKSVILAGGHASHLVIREVRERPANMLHARPVEVAIFGAPLHALTGPVPLNGRYSIFEVTRIMPAYRHSLREVTGRIVARLRRAQRERRIGRFASAWTRKWTGRTSCDARFAREQCQQLLGSRRGESTQTPNVLRDGVVSTYFHG